MERHVAARRRLAAVLLGLAAAVWSALGARSEASERLLWWLAAAIVAVAAMGVWRGLPVAIGAVRRSTASIAILFLMLVALPLTDATGEPASVAARLSYFGPVTIWGLATAALLWGDRPPPPAPARPEKNAPRRSPSGPRRRRRKRR